MRCSTFSVPAALLFVSVSLPAATVVFSDDPFRSSTALTTPGRQVVGGEPSIAFDIINDRFSFEPGIHGVSAPVVFANDVIGNLPATGANVLVLRTFDDDANLATAFGAGNAASLIAGQVTSPGPGFFIYFNQNLDLPRLVYSTDLNSATADLKILARFTNLTGVAGQTALAGVEADNFDFAAVPEPSSVVLMSAAGLLWAGRILRRRARR